MDNSVFQDYLTSCINALNTKQQALFDRYDIGAYDEFELDVAAEEIHFLQDGTVTLRANFVPIGSYDPDSDTWLWGWANEGFPAALREKSAQLKRLEALTGFEMFGNEMTQIDDDMAWELAAMSLALLDVEGVYCGPVNDTHYFYALDRITHVDA